MTLLSWYSFWTRCRDWRNFPAVSWSRVCLDGDGRFVRGCRESRSWAGDGRLVSIGVERRHKRAMSISHPLSFALSLVFSTVCTIRSERALDRGHLGEPVTCCNPHSVANCLKSLPLWSIVRDNLSRYPVFAEDLLHECDDTADGGLHGHVPDAGHFGEVISDQQVVLSIDREDVGPHDLPRAFWDVMLE